MFSLSKFIASKTGRIIMTRCYGIGAALVIIGALFKLEHWQGASYMLSVGMITECIIFFLSAFEPLPVEYHWETVYPELAGDNPNLEDGKNALVKRSQSRGVGGLDIDVETADKFKRNIEHLNASLSSLQALTTVGEASQQFVTGIQQAAGSLNTLTQSTQSMNNAYQETAQIMTNSGREANESMAVLNKNLHAAGTSYELYLKEHSNYVEQNKKLIGTIDASAQQAQQFDQQMLALNKLLTDSLTGFKSLSTTGEDSQHFAKGIQQAAGNLDALNQTTKTMTGAYQETAQTIANSGRQTNENMATLNKNLQAVNTSYELYLQEHRAYAEQSKKLLTTMDTSAQQAQQFDQQMATLNKLIAELNTTYTAMVHTVNTTLKKK